MQAAAPSIPNDNTVDLKKVYDAIITNHSAFDPESVMLYTFPPDWTLDRRTYPENHVLSPKDKAFVATIYPGRAEVWHADLVERP